MRGTEKMRANHHIGARGHRSDLVDVECRGVCCEYAAVSCNLVDFPEDLLLQSHVLEDRFNYDVNVLETIVGKLGADQCHPLTHRLRSQSSLIDRYSVILADREPAAIQSELVGVFKQNRNSCTGQSHSNASPHGSRADDSEAADGVGCGVLRDSGNFRHRALSEESMNQGPRFVSGKT